jgi:hypothetical protein
MWLSKMCVYTSYDCTMNKKRNLGRDFQKVAQESRGGSGVNRVASLDKSSLWPHAEYSTSMAWLRRVSQIAEAEGEPMLYPLTIPLRRRGENHSDIGAGGHARPAGYAALSLPLRREQAMASGYQHAR